LVADLHRLPNPCGYLAFGPYGHIKLGKVRRGKKPLISTPIESLFPGITGQRLGEVANVLGVFAVVFGLAGSLTMGTLQIRAPGAVDPNTGQPPRRAGR
jgi:choline-glycine betaine transporter